MEVRILESGLYSRFEGNKARAQRLSAWEMVDFPAWYAVSLIESGLATRQMWVDPEPSVTDAARKLAEERGIDLAEVEGTGRGGKITLRYVQRA